MARTPNPISPCAPASPISSTAAPAPPPLRSPSPSPRCSKASPTSSPRNVDPSGDPAPGTFVTINDGSGSPPGALVSAVASAVDTVRPVGTQFFVLPPTVYTANISLAITVSDANKAAAQGAVSTAIHAYIASLPIGVPLPVSRVAALAYAAAPNITNVAAITINGGGDLVPSTTGVVIPGAIAVN